ncbi:unnamed protein product [Camellia sinensis]
MSDLSSSKSGISKVALIGIALGMIAGAVTLSAIVSLLILRLNTRKRHTSSRRHLFDLVDKSFIGRLFCHALEDSRPKSALVNSLSVCISLLDPKRLTLGTYHFYSRQLSHGSTISANPETVEGMLESLVLLSTSIGGADYGSVRVGAFIGRKMIKSIASAMLSQSLSSANGNIDELNEDGVELLQAEASLDYLCNLLPHSCSTNSPRLKMGGTIVKNVGSNLKHCWQIIDMKNGCRDYFSGRIAAGCAREYIYFCYGSIAAVDCVHGPHNPIIRPLNRFWFSELPQIHDYIWSY